MTAVRPHQARAAVVVGTFHDVDIGVRVLYALSPNAHHLVQHNLFHGGQYAVSYGDEGPAAYSADRIDYVRNQASGQSQGYGLFAAQQRTLPQWQAATGADADSSDAAVSLVNPGSGDFHLTNDRQVALKQGRASHGVGGPDGTTIPVGAYITGSESIGPD